MAVVSDSQSGGKTMGRGGNRCNGSDPEIFSDMGNRWENAGNAICDGGDLNRNQPIGKPHVHHHQQLNNQQLNNQRNGQPGNDPRSG